MDTSRLNEVKPPQTPQFTDTELHNLHDALDVLVELQFQQIREAEYEAETYGADPVSRGAAALSRHRRDSCPSHHEVGGFFFDSEAIRTASRDRDAPRRREKLRTDISFPRRGLDLARFLPADAYAVYDLFGVINHLGSLSGGHYTARRGA